LKKESIIPDIIKNSQTIFIIISPYINSILKIAYSYIYELSFKKMFRAKKTILRLIKRCDNIIENML